MTLCIKVADKFYCGAKNFRQQSLCVESVIDPIDRNCRMMNADLTCSIGCQINHKHAELVYEDNLPDDITDDQYNWWYDRSFVDFFRIGPKIPGT